MEIVDLDKWDYVSNRVKHILKFEFDNYSEKFIKRRFEVRLRILGIKSYMEYLDYINNNPDEASKLLKEMTIHVTNFYRDSTVFDLLRKELLPRLINQAYLEARPIKIWSAGCSTGEETITVAILLDQACRNYGRWIRHTILGTDRDKQSVISAISKRFFPEQFKEMPKELIDKYFDQHDDYYEFKGIRNENIRFEVGDILSAKTPNNLDLILCRNTVIYFDNSAKSKLYEKFFEILKHNGFLILGKTESLIGPARDKFESYNLHEKVFHKN
ncbi:protein-glutamate O-methyltransferase CheR [Candidatus Woesearchaeota archaeon]|nr:protein-glutamate O-methyltransferase CheR [Candidatus Woesearchaeota archaeon]